MNSLLALVALVGSAVERPLIVVPKLTEREVVLQLVDPRKSLQIIYRRKFSQTEVKKNSDFARLNLAVTASPSGTKLLLPIVTEKGRSAEFGGVVLSMEGKVESLPKIRFDEKLPDCPIFGWDGETPCVIDAEVEAPSKLWRYSKGRWNHSTTSKLPDSFTKIFNTNFHIGAYAPSGILRFSPNWQICEIWPLDAPGGFHYQPMQIGSSQYGTAMFFGSQIVLLETDGVAQTRGTNDAIDSLMPIGNGQVLGRTFAERMLLPGFEDRPYPNDPFMVSNVFLWDIQGGDPLHLAEGLFGIPVGRAWAKTIQSRERLKQRTAVRI